MSFDLFTSISVKTNTEDEGVSTRLVHLRLPAAGRHISNTSIVMRGTEIEFPHPDLPRFIASSEVVMWGQADKPDKVLGYFDVRKAIINARQLDLLKAVGWVERDHEEC